MAWLSATLVACGYIGPTEKEVRAALEPLVNQKGCIYAKVFANFPVEKHGADAEGSMDIINIFIGLNFIREEDDAYVLTEQGREAYDQKEKGFCYTRRYEISDVSIGKKKSEIKLAPGMSGPWEVSFRSFPSNVDGWILNPKIFEIARMKEGKVPEVEELNGTRSFTILFIHKEGQFSPRYIALPVRREMYFCGRCGRESPFRLQMPEAR